jgi:hypothetical protein
MVIRLEAFLLDVVVNSIELTKESFELLLLLSEGILASEDARLALALILLLLEGGSSSSLPFSFHGGVSAKQNPFRRFIDVRVGPDRVVARIVLEQVEDGRRLATDDGH